MADQNNSNAVLSAPNAAAAVSMSREAMEVITQMQIAHAYPRDVQKSLDRIVMACTRPKLAEAAIYTYQKGGSDVSGPSIRLAECIAQNWGNMGAGVRELEQRDNGSMCESFAIDYETNTRMTKSFFVSHIRHTKKGDYLVTDPREIYEMVANNGARRLRACILAVVPGDIVEEAVAQCEKTVKASADVTPGGIRKLLGAFAQIEVTQAQIEKYIQRRIDAITPSQVVKLRGIYQSIKDGMSKPESWFEVEAPVEAEAEDPAKAKGKAANMERFKKASQEAAAAIRKGKVPPKPETPPNMEFSPSSGDPAADVPPPEEAGDAIPDDDAIQDLI